MKFDWKFRETAMEKISGGSRFRRLTANTGAMALKKLKELAGSG